MTSLFYQYSLYYIGKIPWDEEKKKEVKKYLKKYINTLVEKTEFVKTVRSILKGKDHEKIQYINTSL